MRVKTDDRRRAIVEAASGVFQEFGFDGASMSAISEALGGSKTTLYSYFESKEELYEAVMIEAVEAQVDSFLIILDHPSGDLRKPLLKFGTAYLEWVLSREVVTVVRSGIEMRDDGLGPRLFARGPKRCWDHVAVFLKKSMDDGWLQLAEPVVAALHLKGLLQAGLFEPFLFGAPAIIPHSRAVELAVDAFLRAYRPGRSSIATRSRSRRDDAQRS